MLVSGLDLWCQFLTDTGLLVSSPDMVLSIIYLPITVVPYRDVVV